MKRISQPAANKPSDIIFAASQVSTNTRQKPKWNADCIAFCGVCVCNVFLMVCMFFAVPQERLSEKIKALKQQKLPRHVGIHDKIKFQFRFKLHHSTS